MSRIPWRNTGLFLVAILAAWGLKAHYSGASAGDLKWILGPTATLVSACTGVPFLFEAGEGYASADRMTVIAPVCAGVNFMIICFLMLVGLCGARPRRFGGQALIFSAAAAGAYAVTLGVNSARIWMAMAHARTGFHGGGWTPDRLHRLEGVAVYFLALSVVYLVVEGVLRGREESPKPLFGPMVPMFWYLAVTLGIPLLRGSFRPDPAAFVEHALVVTAVPLAIVLASVGLRLTLRPRAP